MTIDDGTRRVPDPWGRPPTGSAFATEGTPKHVAPGGVAPGSVAPNDAKPAETTAEVERRPRAPRRNWPLGHTAFGLAVLLVILEGVAVYLASFGQPVAATILSQVLVVVTVIPFALGLLAVIRNRKRGWGIAAMALSLFANPVILLTVLRFFGSI